MLLQPASYVVHFAMDDYPAVFWSLVCGYFLPCVTLKFLTHFTTTGRSSCNERRHSWKEYNPPPQLQLKSPLTLDHPRTVKIRGGVKYSSLSPYPLHACPNSKYYAHKINSRCGHVACTQQCNHNCEPAVSGLRLSHFIYSSVHVRLWFW